MSKTNILALGRLGDVTNILPLAWAENNRGNRCSIVVAKEFADLLDGVSYADRIVWQGKYDRPDQAWQWLTQVSAHRHEKNLNAQPYRHPTDKNHKTRSYQTEAWRLAGKLDEFGCWPLILDRRDKTREAALAAPFEMSGKPIILVGLHSVSSPYPNEGVLFSAIKDSFGKNYEVVDLRSVKAVRAFDLLGLFDRAVCLVSVDTLFLHLARASSVPVIAITNQEKADGWFASVPPPNAFKTFRYSSDRFEVIGAIEHFFNLPTPGEFHAVDDFGDSPRHTRARDTWPDFASAVRANANWRMAYDPRKPPFLRDLLQHANDYAQPEDVIVWSNSDTLFAPMAFDRIREHVRVWGATSIRRKEIGLDGTHIGRDVFAFRADHLREVIMPTLPDFALAAPCFDLVLAAIIRKARGINSTKENMLLDFFPCEMTPGLVLHEPHESEWAGQNENILPANLLNKRLAQEWCRENMPGLHL